jgi:alginate biosynthesis protein AlgX
VNISKFMTILIAPIILLCGAGIQAKNQSVNDSDVQYPCLEAANEYAYKGSFLQNFVLLQEGRDGWLFRNQDLKKSFGPGPQGLKKLDQLSQALQAKGTALVMVPIPTRPLVHPQALGGVAYDAQSSQQAYANYLQSLRGAGVIVPSLEKLYNQPMTKPLFFSRDHHWNDRGSRSVARFTAHAIKKSPYYTSLEPQVFESQMLNKHSNHGSLQKAAERICGKRYGKESFKVYQTAPVYNADDDSDIEVGLFGEMQAADVVLVGTSNSHGKLNFNFSGFLSQYSKLNVVNMAMSGGGYKGAIKRYLASDDFHAQPPRFLVWEMPSYYSLNDTEFLDEVLNMVRGEL